MPLFRARTTFAVPATAGQYAPERITLASSSASIPSPELLGVTILIESAPASAAVELWLLRDGGDPTNDSDYFAYKSTTSSETYPLASFAGAQIRAVSGGTGGNLVATATAD